MKSLRILALSGFLALAMSSCSQKVESSEQASTQNNQNTNNTEQGEVITMTDTTQLPDSDVKEMYALMKTSMGDMKIKLFHKRAPLTVANFVGLAEGTKEYTDPNTGDKTKGKYYDGLIFHRVIPGFMIL